MRKPFFPLIKKTYCYPFSKAFPLDISRKRKMKKVIKFIQGLQQSEKAQALLLSNLKYRQQSKTHSCTTLTHWGLTEGLGATSEVGPPIPWRSKLRATIPCCFNKIRNSLSRSQKNPTHFPEGGKPVLFISFPPSRDNLHACTMQNDKKKNIKYSVPLSGKQVQSDFKILLHSSSFSCSSLFITSLEKQGSFKACFNYQILASYILLF